MFISEGTPITHDARFFLEPGNAHHRQYEALRAFFVEGFSSAQAAARFGYSVGSFRVLVHKFRHGSSRDFFSASAKGPQAAPKSDPLREEIIALRKQNFSIYDISRALAKEGHPLSPVAISLVLKEQGFARLPPSSLGVTHSGCSSKTTSPMGSTSSTWTPCPRRWP